MNLITAFFFPGRLAWRQLIYDRTKLIAAISGVLFSTVLVFMQIGFRDALYDGAASAPTKMNGDLFLLHKQTEAMFKTIQFDRSELMRALGHTSVTSVYPMYMSLGEFKNIQTQRKNQLMVYGYDIDGYLISDPQIQTKQNQLRVKDTVLFDEASRPEFGPMRELLDKGKDVTEINDYKIKIIGLFRLGVSFAADGNVITSDMNFLRIFPRRVANQIDLGVIKLKPGADVHKVQSEMISLLNNTVNVMRYDELVGFEQQYWRTKTPIGFIFGFSTIMALVVGMVIVYQILFTDITNHLNEFATLKAMGYKSGYFVRVVFASALFLAVLGFVPGYLISNELYGLAEKKIFMSMPMTPNKILTIFSFILTMCVSAGVLAVRKLKAANPADMF